MNSSALIVFIYMSHYNRKIIGISYIFMYVYVFVAWEHWINSLGNLRKVRQSHEKHFFMWSKQSSCFISSNHMENPNSSSHLSINRRRKNGHTSLLIASIHRMSPIELNQHSTNPFLFRSQRCLIKVKLMEHMKEKKNKKKLRKYLSIQQEMRQTLANNAHRWLELDTINGQRRTQHIIYKYNIFV